jgi:hypothetical protein
MKTQFALLVLNIITGAACAGDPCNQFEIVLYGRVWQVTSYFVQDDITVNPNKDFEMLEPDGAAYQQGYLYVSGDREEWNTGSRLAVYSWQNNILTYLDYLQMPSTSPDWWGPDGLTFNTSGDPNSYGSGAGELVSVEADAPAQVGIINISTDDVTGRKMLPSSEDITYIASTGKFASVASGTENSTVTIYDKTITFSERNFSITNSTYGLAWASNDFGQRFSRQDISSAEGFLLAAAKDSANKIVMVDLAGNEIGIPQELPITPKARISLGGGLTMIEPAFGQIEAIAVDEQNDTIFIGDHGNAMIHVLAPVRLAGDVNDDGTVDFSDLVMFAARWLSLGCLDPQWCDGADMNHSGDVDFGDFAVIAQQYGQGI